MSKKYWKRTKCLKGDPTWSSEWRCLPEQSVNSPVKELLLFNAGVAVKTNDGTVYEYANDLPLKWSKNGVTMSAVIPFHLRQLFDRFETKDDMVEVTADGDVYKVWRPKPWE